MKQTTELPKLSASRIKVYKTCARQYEFKYKMNHSERPLDDKNTAALMGTALHEAIEMYYKEKINPVSTFQRVMHDTIDEWEKEKLKINAASYFTTAMQVGTKILRDFDWNQFNPTELELEFTLPFPNKEKPIAFINGYIDLLDMDGSIVDFKSSKYAPNADELNNDPQFILYRWAYEEIYGVVPHRVIWYHLRTNKTYVANVEKDYSDKIAQLKSDIEAMLFNNYYPRRLQDSTCRTKCSFYELCYGQKSSVEKEED